MAKAGSTPTRVSADVFDAATAVASEEHRSAAEQVNHWARLGMQLERSSTVAFRMVREVAAGRAQFSALAGPDRQFAHALVDTAISDRVASSRFGPAERREGKRTVSIDEHGTLIEIGPDGAIRTL